MQPWLLWRFQCDVFQTYLVLRTNSILQEGNKEGSKLFIANTNISNNMAWDLIMMILKKKVLKLSSMVRGDSFTSNHSVIFQKKTCQYSSSS